MGKTYQKPEALSDQYTHYCPGCTHGVIHRLVAEGIDELGIRGRTVGIAPVGCAVLAYNYFTFDFQESAHGRAPAMATGIKRVRPDLIVFTYQGDGDLASIGIAEIIHAANRGEKFTTVFVNNAVYGMTGGQMAPTTLLGQRATSCPDGRNARLAGYPIRFAEMIAQLDAPVYVTRQALYDQKRVMAAGRAIRKAFKCQIEDRGYSLVEILTTCPTNWRMSPIEANSHVMNKVIRAFPLGDLTDRY